MKVEHPSTRHPVTPTISRVQQTHERIRGDLEALAEAEQVGHIGAIIDDISLLLKEHFEEVIVELPKGDLGQAAGRIGSRVLEARDRVEIPTRDVDALVRELQGAGVGLGRMRVRPPTLEDLFLSLTGKELRG